MLEDCLVRRLPKPKVEPVDKTEGRLGANASLKALGWGDVKPNDAVVLVDFGTIVLILATSVGKIDRARVCRERSLHNGQQR